MIQKYIVTLLLCCAYVAHAAESTESFELLFSKGSILFKEKSYAKAADIYRKAIELQPQNYQTYFNLGVCLFKLKEFTQAEDALNTCLAMHPTYARAHLYKGKILCERGQYPEAITILKKSLHYDARNIDTIYTLADALKHELRAEEAITILRGALQEFNNDAHLEFTLANMLNMAGHTQESLDIYLKLNDEHPNDPGIVYNIAYTYKKLGLMAECLPYYEQALALKPDHSEARFSQGLAHLVLGNWEKGWKGYEYRWDRSDHLKGRTYQEPMWDGSAPLDGKHIFVYAEQGLGDTFQFIRYLRILKDMGAHVTFAPQSPLQDIIKLCPYIDEVIPFTRRPTHFDYHVPLLSLPYLCKTRINTVPMDIPYIYADEELVQLWKEKLANDHNFKIGICWQGNPDYKTPFLRAAVAGKSMPASFFEPLSHIPGVSLYCLQHITGTEQLKELPPTMKLIRFTNDFDASHGRFMDTAALIKNLDLVITVDTSICHLSAALGAHVWTFIPNPPDWRWMLKRTDTPWYPNMRLFRQETPGDWRTTMQRVTQKVTRLLYTQKRKQNNELEPPHIASYGALLNTIARTQAMHDNSNNAEKKEIFKKVLEKIVRYAETIQNTPLIQQYMQELYAIHMHRLQSNAVRNQSTVLEKQQNFIIKKIDLLVQLTKEVRE